MQIAITTPTGHVGSVVADFLLDFGGDIRVKLLGRRPDKLARFTRRGAETSIGSLDDVNYLVRATQDADALLWVTPPGYGSDNLRAYQKRLAAAAAAAIRSTRVPRVVNLSSIGAEQPSGAGPISGLHDVEKLLEDAAPNITHLRPGFFFENLLGQADSIRDAGIIALPVAGTRRYPLIASCDIGRVAAQRLAERNWRGRNVRELHGSADLSFDEIAAVLSQALGRPIRFVQCSRQQARQAILDRAVSENVADQMLEMYDAVQSGRVRPQQPRSPETTTSTTLEEFARDVLRPLLAEIVAR